jgi:hypothetical protein
MRFYALLLPKLGIWPMIVSKALGRHSRENGNPEPKNQYPWIPASEGMTNQKNIELIFKNLETFGKY